MRSGQTHSQKFMSPPNFANALPELQALLG